MSDRSYEAVKSEIESAEAELAERRTEIGSNDALSEGFRGELLEKLDAERVALDGRLDAALAKGRHELEGLARELARPWTDPALETGPDDTPETRLAKSQARLEAESRIDARARDLRLRFAGLEPERLLERYARRIESGDAEEAAVLDEAIEPRMAEADAGVLKRFLELRDAARRSARPDLYARFERRRDGYLKLARWATARASARGDRKLFGAAHEAYQRALGLAGS